MAAPQYHTSPPASMLMTNETCRWLDMFETLCARQRCRSIEALAAAGDSQQRLGEDRLRQDDVLFIGGPSGRWLAEVTSVSLRRRSRDDSVRLADSSRAAVLAVARSYERWSGVSSFDNNADFDNDLIVVLDWFALRSSGLSSPSLSFVGRDANATTENRQCLLRIDRNNGLVTLLLLANTTNLQELPSVSIVCNAHLNDCLRPFPFILACELAVRRVDYENMNLHHDSFRPTACWLNKGRELHRRAKWIRIVGYDGNAVDTVMRDRILCERVNATNIRLVWRDGHIFRQRGPLNGSGESLFTAQSTHLLPVSAIIDLGAMARDVRRDERTVLSLCDFDVFSRRCADNLASNWFSAAATTITTTMTSLDAYDVCQRVPLCHRDDASKLYESRYYVTADNELISRRIVTLS